MTPAGTKVSSEKCQVCSSSQGYYDSETGQVRWICTRSLMGIQPCKSFSRDESR
jgi:hypothetical protein